MSNVKLAKITNSTFKHKLSALICCQKDINADQFQTYYIYKEADYIKFILDNKFDFDLIIITDDELPELNLYPEMEWNALFANQTYRYYDVANWRSSTIMNIQQHYPKDSGFIPVDSAYGGLAIYRSRSIQVFKTYPKDIVELNFRVLTHKYLDCSLQLKTTDDKKKLYQDFL